MKIRINEEVKSPYGEFIDKSLFTFVEDVQINIDYIEFKNYVKNRINDIIKENGYNVRAEVEYQTDCITVQLLPTNNYTYPIGLLIYFEYKKYDGLSIICENSNSHYREKYKGLDDSNDYGLFGYINDKCQEINS